MHSRCGSVVTLVLLVSCLTGLAFGQESKLAVTLVTNGKPGAVIVLPDTAVPQSPEQKAAELLAVHVRQMSGASLPIKRERELGAVRVENGRLHLDAAQGVPGGDALLGREHVPGEEAPRMAVSFVLVGPGDLVRRLGVDATGVGVGGIRLKTTGNALVLLGGPGAAPGEMGDDPDGIRYAALELLERLGCAYLWPGPLGKVVPRRATVVVDPLDVNYTPSIRRRYLRWNGWSDRSDQGLKNLGLTKEQMEQWQAASRARRNTGAAREDLKAIDWTSWHRGGGRMPNFGHAGMGLRDGARHLKEHPEWFALQADGTRDQLDEHRWCLCLSNQDLIAHVANDIIEQGRKDPTLAIVSLDANDGSGNTGQCLCDKCRALDSPEAPRIEMMTFGARLTPGQNRRTRAMIEHPSLTDRMAWYWNRVAERVVTVHPNMLFGISAYSLWTHPPVRQKFHPNLVVRWVPSELDHLKGWQNAGLRQAFWRPNILLFNRRDGKLKSYVGPLTEAMNQFADVGIRQTDFDSVIHFWATAGASYYAAARLNWNPRLTVEEIVDDYARSGFGPGADNIKKYWRRVEELSREGVKVQHTAQGDFRYTPPVVTELRALLNAAEAAAAKDEEIRARIAFLRLGLNYTALHETLDDMARRAQENDPGYDPGKARRFLDLHTLVLHDLLINHEWAVNVPMIAWGSGGFAKWRALPKPVAGVSDETLLARVRDPQYGQTGREDSFEAMFTAFGLEAPK
jgi:hypothetical protein